jgi:hypothetical protein
MEDVFGSYTKSMNGNGKENRQMFWTEKVEIVSVTLVAKASWSTLQGYA